MAKSNEPGSIIGNWKLLVNLEAHRSHILPDFHQWRIECLTCHETYVTDYKKIKTFSCPYCTVKAEFAETERLTRIRRLNQRGMLRQMELWELFK